MGLSFQDTGERKAFSVSEFDHPAYSRPESGGNV